MADVKDLFSVVMRNLHNRCTNLNSHYMWLFFLLYLYFSGREEGERKVG